MPAPTTYTSEQLFATRDGLRIYGQLFLPKDTRDDKPLPLLVCAHDFGSNYLSCVPYAWAMAEAGFATYCFDFCGGGYASRSEGNPLDMTLLTESADIAAVLDMLRMQPGIDPKRLYILGEGQGALAAAVFAGRHPGEVEGLILVHPTFNLHDQARSLFPTKKNIPTSYRQQGMRVGRSYGEVAWELNPYTLMQEFANDVLIVHGDEDVVVPLDYARRAATVYPNAKLVVLHGGRQTFRGDVAARCIAEVAAFLA